MYRMMQQYGSIIIHTSAAAVRLKLEPVDQLSVNTCAYFETYREQFLLAESRILEVLEILTTPTLFICIYGHINMYACKPTYYDEDELGAKCTIGVVIFSPYYKNELTFTQLGC